MAKSEFGEHKYFDTTMREALSEALEKTGRLDSITARRLMQERYETVYQLRDHDQPNAHPLGIMLMNPAEDNTTGGPLERRIRDFKLFNVGKYWNCSFFEWIDNPRDVVESMLKIAKEEVNKEAAAAAEAQAKADAAVAAGRVAQQQQRQHQQTVFRDPRFSGKPRGATKR